MSAEIKLRPMTTEMYHAFFHGESKPHALRWLREADNI